MDNSKLVSRQLSTLFLISIVIGVLAGIFSWLFRLLIGFIHNIAFLGQISGEYNANLHTPGSYLGWLIIFVPVLGGLVVVYLIKNYAPQAKGHGVPEVMHAIYHKRGLIPGNVSIVKALASAITIGTGGSLGREGPIVQISAAFSSFIGRITRLTVSQRNLMIACGASSGIAATFNAPLGGLLFSIELLLVSVNSRTILPVAVATVISANVGQFLIGNEPAFNVPELIGTIGGSNLSVTLLAIIMGGFIGLLSIVFIKSIYFSEDFFNQIPVNDYVKHMIGTLILGLIFYSIFLYSGHYYVQGVGYSTIQDVLMDLIKHPGFLLFLLVAKLIATSLTIGSGGSGGVFSPSLFLGAVFGAIFGNIISILFPELGINPIIFVISGMAAMVSGTTSAPLTAAIIVYEMTLNYNAVLPIMAAVSVAYAVRRHFMKSDIYTLKLNRRGQMIPEDLVADLKSHIVIEEAVSKKMQFLAKGDNLSWDQDFACLLDDDDQVINIIDIKHQHPGHKILLEDMNKLDFIILKTGTTVSDAVNQFYQKKCDVIVVSRDGSAKKESIAGIVSAGHLIDLIGDVSSILK